MQNRRVMRDGVGAGVREAGVSRPLWTHGDASRETTLHARQRVVVQPRRKGGLKGKSKRRRTDVVEQKTTTDE